MSLSRLHEGGSSSEEEQKQLESDIAALQQEMETHREHALKSHESYIAALAWCNQNWKEITDLEAKDSKTDEEEEKLVQLKQCYTAVISADYQMSKLVPYWGLSPQPGSTYYLPMTFWELLTTEKEMEQYTFLMRDWDQKTQIIATVSYLTHFMKNCFPMWLKRVHLFLDNACRLLTRMHLHG